MPRGGRTRLSAVVLGAGLLACALPAPGLWPLAWVGLVPLIFAVNTASTRREAGILGLAAGLAYHGVVLHWIYQTCRFAQVPMPVSVLAWLALSSFLALNLAVVSALTKWLSDAVPRAVRPWLWALCWTAVAAAAERFTPRLAVDLLAYTQWPNLAFLQASSWGGPHIVGFAVCLVNAALAEAWQEAPEGFSGVGATLAASLALCGGMWMQGVWTLIQRPTTLEPSARVEILQPCVEQYHKWDKAFIDSILSGYDELLARPHAKAPALVIWPETSIPRWVSGSVAVPEGAKWAKALRAPQLVGIIAENEGDRGPSNAVQLIAPDGKLDGFYAKRELVPFGEFVPLRERIPRFVIDNWLGILDQLGDLTPGAPRQPLLHTSWGKTTVTICYEAVFPRWARLDADRGAQLMINVTNDGWYKDTWGPRQHYRANVFRAIENRLTVIRAGNTGISAVIDPWGVVTAELDLNVRGRLDADVPLNDPFPERSFYSRHGDWFGVGAMMIVLLVVLRRSLR
jgi:apolipoprotein N-acyltransferase